MMATLSMERPHSHMRPRMSTSTSTTHSMTSRVAPKLATKSVTMTKTATSARPRFVSASRSIMAYCS